MNSRAIFESEQFKKVFGNYIKTEREKQGLLQQDICFELGITQAYYSTIENGKKEIGIILAKKICDVLGLRFDDFLKRFQEGTNQPSNESKGYEHSVWGGSDDVVATTKTSHTKERNPLNGMAIQKKGGKACSIYLSEEAIAKLDMLAKHYGCGKGKIVEELLKNIP